MSRVVRNSGITRSVTGGVITAFTNNDPAVAYVRTSGTAGGIVGNPAKPFATWQQASDAGALVFDFGVGTALQFGGLVTGGSKTMFIRGRGLGKTALGTISTPQGTTVILVDSGNRSCSIASIIGNGLNGDDGANPDDPGQPGGNAANISLTNVHCLGSIGLLGGNGGAANIGGLSADGGAGGAGGNLTMVNSYCDTVFCNGGNGGVGYDAGSPGADGTGGSVYLSNNSQTSNMQAKGGNGPAGNGMGGTLAINYSTTGELDLDGPGGVGSISGSFANISNIVSGTPAGLVAYVNAGTFVP